MWQISITGIWLLLLSVSDIRKKSFPVWMLGIGVVGAAGVLCLEMAAGRVVGVSILKSVLPGLLFLLIAAVTKNMGYGDGMVLILLGLMRGQKHCVTALMLGMLVISFFAVVVLILRRAGRNTRLPFLPFLSVGWVIAECLLQGGT